MPDNLSYPQLTAYAKSLLEQPPVSYDRRELPYLGTFEQEDEPYDVTDYPTVRERLQNNIAAAISQRFPLESDKYVLTLENLQFADKGFSPKDEKDALLHGKTLGTKVKGDWVLYDKATGKELERKDGNTLVNIPYLTNRGVFIRSGNEYGLRNTFRLRPGIYTRIKSDGVIASHVNPAQGTGTQSNIILNPNSGVFTWKIGSRHYGLLPMMLAAGEDPETIRKAWGDELFDNNYKKYANIIEGTNKREAAEYQTLWKDKLSKEVLDKETTEDTLGQPFAKLTGPTLLATTGKLLKVAQTYTDQDTDDRNNLRFQTIAGVADYLPERIARDGGGVFRKILNKIDKDGNLGSVNPGVFQPHIDSIFQEARHSVYIDGANPLEATDIASSLSRIGEGGLGSERAASEESRGVSNSYLGFVDPIRCYAKDTELLTAKGWKKIQHITLSDRLACLVGGSVEYQAPLSFHIYDYQGNLYGYKDAIVSYLVTANHRMIVQDGDWLRVEYADDVHGQSGYKVRTGLDTEEFHELDKEAFYRVKYKGQVFCPTVKGGIVYCRKDEKSGFFCGNSPESANVGLQGFMTHGVRKDSKGQLWTRVRTMDRSKPFYARMADMMKGTVATPEYYDPNADPEELIPAFKRGGDLEYVPRKDVNYYIADSSRLMSDNTGFIAGIGGIRSNRTMLGSKASIQALSLPNREAPLVRRYLEKDDGTPSTTEEFMGKKLGAKFADTDGIVTSVDSDKIVYKDQDGVKHTVELYNNLPANNKGWLHNTPLVKPGDTILKGQPIAKSNYTDDKGVAANGVNLRVAMVNAPNGGTALDAITVSESAARTKLASEQLYKTRVPKDNETEYDKNKFLRSFNTSDFTKEQLETVGEDGIVKPGTELHKGDPIVLGISVRDVGIRGVSKKSLTPLIKVWEHDYPGVVTDVGDSSRNYTVYTKAQTPARVGDKLSPLFGNKGVIGQILPDEEMLRDKNGIPFEVYQSPMGIPSRVNPMALASLQLGKIAKHTGKPVVWRDFTNEPMADTVLQMLKDNGLQESEDLYDPATGKTVPDVSTGYLYYLKFKHQSDVKEKARGTGEYTLEGLPLKGGKESARRFGSMEIGALIGHGGADSEILKDAKLIRGQENNEFWRAVRNGDQLPKVDIPLVNKKFFAHLQAAGVNLEDRGNRIHMFAADDNDIKRLTQARQVQNNSTYDAKELRPITGGLFDPAIFGPRGDQWAYYQLPEPILNPLMEKSVANILGWKEQDLQGVLNGEQEIDGKMGPKAVQDELAKLNVEREFNKAREQLKSSTLPALKRDKLLKKYRALGALLKEGKNPSDLFLTRIPILPPRFRPVSVLGNDVGIVSDANYLYKAMIDAANDFQEAKQALPEDMQLDARKNLHQAVTSVIGLTDSPDRKLQEKDVEGVLKWAFGKGSPKFSALHRKIYGSTVDLGGLAVIAGDSKLGIDEIGLPEESAWRSFEPFVVRNLRRRHGYSLADAMKAAQERTPRAKEALEEELKKRPVLVNRAPTLHKYNLMAFWPKLTKNNTLTYNPLLSKNFGADSDGDMMSFHVPVSKKAVREAAEKMLPSKNLFSPATLKTHILPLEEFAQGLYLASRPGKGQPVKFKTKADMLRALNAGEIKYDTPVDIEELNK